MDSSRIPPGSVGRQPGTYPTKQEPLAQPSDNEYSGLTPGQKSIPPSAHEMQGSSIKDRKIAHHNTADDSPEYEKGQLDELGNEKGHNDTVHKKGQFDELESEYEKGQLDEFENEKGHNGTVYKKRQFDELESEKEYKKSFGSKGFNSATNSVKKSVSKISGNNDPWIKGSPAGSHAKRAFFIIGGLVAAVACCAMCMMPGAVLIAYPFFIMGMMAHMFSYFDAGDAGQSGANNSNEPAKQGNDNQGQNRNIHPQGAPAPVDYSGKDPERPVPPPPPGFNGVTPQQMYNAATGMGLPGPAVNGLMNGMQQHVQAGGSPFDPRAAMALAQQFTPPQMLMGLGPQLQAYQQQAAQWFQHVQGEANKLMGMQQPQAQPQRESIVINNNNTNTNNNDKDKTTTPSEKIEDVVAKPEEKTPPEEKKRKITLRVKVGEHAVNDVVNRIQEVAPSDEGADKLKKAVNLPGPGPEAENLAPPEAPEPPKAESVPPVKAKPAVSKPESRGSAASIGISPEIIELENLPEYDRKKTGLLNNFLKDHGVETKNWGQQQWDALDTWGDFYQKQGSLDNRRKNIPDVPTATPIVNFRAKMQMRFGSQIGDLYSSWSSSDLSNKQQGDVYFENSCKKYFGDLVDAIIYERYKDDITADNSDFKDDGEGLDYNYIFQRMAEEIEKGKGDTFPDHSGLKKMFKHWVAFLAADKSMNRSLAGVRGGEDKTAKKFDDFARQPWYQELMKDDIYTKPIEKPTDEVNKKLQAEKELKETKLPAALVLRSPKIFLGKKQGRNNA